MTRSPQSVHVLSPLFSWRGMIAKSKLPPSAKLVAFTLSLHMNEAGGSCFPSVETLAAETSMARRTVFYAIKQLRVEGWLICHRRFSEVGQQRTNVYEAVIPMGVQEMQGGVQEMHQGGATVAPKDVIEDVKGNRKTAVNNFARTNVLPRDPAKAILTKIRNGVIADERFLEDEIRGFKIDERIADNLRLELAGTLSS